MLIMRLCALYIFPFCAFHDTDDVDIYSANGTPVAISLAYKVIASARYGAHAGDRNCLVVPLITGGTVVVADYT